MRSDELTRLSHVVLATGGGAVLDPHNRQALAGRGCVIYLHAPMAKLIQRTAKDRNRPLLQISDRAERLKTIVTERDPLYRAVADIVVETGDRRVQHVVNDILRRLGTHEDP